MLHVRFTELLVIAICLAVVTACAAPATPASPAPEAGSEGAEVTAEVVVTPIPTLRVGVPFAWAADEHLVTSLCDANANLGYQIELVVPADYGGGFSIPTDCAVSIAPVLQGPPPVGYCSGHGHPDMDPGYPPIDLYLYDTQSVRHAIESGRLSQVTDITATPLDQLGAAFAKEGTLYGVPAGTAPLLGVANPEIFAEAGYDIDTLRGDWTWANMTDVVKQLAKRSDQRGTITLPADLSLAVAACQSLLGEACNEEAMFSGETFDAMLAFLADGNEILSQPNVVPENGDIVSNFANGQIALAVTRPGFLTALAATGYQGDIAILPFPRSSYPGGAAMGYGWVVPSASQQQNNAWKLADFLSKNGNMQKWALANGLLPGTTAGIDEALQPGSVTAENLLPSLLLTQESELDVLKGIAAQSKAWQIPPAVNLEKYRSFIELGNQLIPYLLELSKNGNDGAAVEWLTNLNDLGKNASQ